MPLLRDPYNPATPNSFNNHNAAVNPVIDGVNNHAHDPNSTNNTTASGSYIPQFGSADSRYASTGPGSASWNTLSSQTNQAAIPADPNETAIDPLTGSIITSGTASTYSGITYGHGIGIELARIRGQLAKLTGQKWYTSVGSVVSFDVGGSGRDLTLGTMNATTGSFSPPVGSAPFAVNLGGGSPIMVTNLNTQYVGGYATANAPGTASTILATNSQGLFTQTWVAADTSQSATYNSSLTTSNTIQDNLNNIRYVLQQWAQAALGPGATWSTPATTTPTFLSSVTVSGQPLSGAISLHSGVGIAISQDSSSSLRFDVTGTAPTTDAPVVTYPDFFLDTVISGTITPSTSGMTITVPGGMIGYVSGFRNQTVSGYTFGPYTVTTGANYVWWNGTSAANAYQVTTTNTSPGQGWILVATGTLTGTATNATQTTAGGAWALAKKVPILNTVPTITGSRSGGTALTSLLSQLNSMGFVVDSSTA